LSASRTVLEPIAWLSNALQGFQWAIQRHKATGEPQVLSNSWGIYQQALSPDYATNPDHPFTRKVLDAINEGILVLFAAGNCGEVLPRDPVRQQRNLFSRRRHGVADLASRSRRIIAPP
jgi:hypothetical protein